MISIYAFSLFLWLAVLAPEQVASDILKSVDRAGKGDHFIFTIKYKPATLGLTWSDSLKEKESDGGTTKLKFKKGQSADAFFMLGDLDAHYVKVVLNTEGNDDRSARLDYQFSLLHPGTDLISQPNNKTKLTAVVHNGRGNGLLMFAYFDVDVTGVYCDKTTHTTTASDEPTFVNQTVTGDLGVTTTTVEFTADENTIRGNFTAMLEGDAASDNLPIETVNEYFVFTVHGEDEDILREHGSC